MSTSALLKTFDWMRKRIIEQEQHLDKDVYLLKEAIAAMTAERGTWQGEFDAEHQARLRAETAHAAALKRITELEACASTASLESDGDDETAPTGAGCESGGDDEV